MNYIINAITPEIMITALVVLLLIYISFKNYKFHSKENKVNKPAPKKKEEAKPEKVEPKPEVKAEVKTEEIVTAPIKNGLTIPGKKDNNGNIEVKAVIEKRGDEGLLEIPIQNKHDLKLSPDNSDIEDLDKELKIEILGDDDDGITEDLRRMMFENSLNNNTEDKEEE